MPKNCAPPGTGFEHIETICGRFVPQIGNIQFSTAPGIKEAWETRSSPIGS